MAARDVLAIDVGGTYVKAALVVGGDVADVVRIPVPGFLDASGALGEMGLAREIDPVELDTAIETALARLAADATRCQTFVSGQMGGLAFVDDDGRAIAPLISWQDTRVDDVDAVAVALGPSVRADLGDGLRVGSPIVTLSGLDRPPGSRVTSILGYVAGRIAGTRAGVLHATDAGSWGMLDTRTAQWSAPACTVAGVSAQALPRVTTSVEPVAAGAPVMVGVGDQQAALLGAGLQPGWLSVNLATGCQVAVLSDDFDCAGQTRPYFGAVHGGRYLHTVTHLPAGRLLAAAVRAARGDSSDADWAWVAEKGHTEPGVATAMDAIVDGIVQGAERIDGRGLPVLFSGGVVQGLPLLRARLITALGAPQAAAFDGDDAALAGLAVLASAT